MNTSAPRLRVLQVITKGEQGGAQSHVFTLCEALRDEIDLAVAMGPPGDHSALGQRLTAMNIPVFSVASLSNGLSPLRLWRATSSLRRTLRHFRPDVLHAHSAAAGVIARVAGWLTHTPVVYTVHGFAFKPGAPWPRRMLAWAVECMLAPLTAHMVCVSRHERQWARMLPLHARRISVVHNAIADVTVRACPEREMRILSVARMASPKRPDLLLHALSQVKQTLGQEFPTTLVGSGPNLAALQVLAKHLGLQSVDFLGERTDVEQLLVQHTVFVLLSDHEGLPISILEAMRAGLPIVASDLPGVRELLPAATEGILVANQVLRIAEALQELASAPTMRASLGHAARQRYTAHFKPDGMAASLRQIYVQLAQSP